MLDRFFKNDNNTSDTKGRSAGRTRRARSTGQQWRFKGHAEDAVLALGRSWARAMRRPSDLGLRGRRLHPAAARAPAAHRRGAHRPEGDAVRPPRHRHCTRNARNSGARSPSAASRPPTLVDDDQPAVAWCHLNDEGDLLTQLIPGAVQVSGSDDSPSARRKRCSAFSRGRDPGARDEAEDRRVGAELAALRRMTFFPVALLRAVLPGRPAHVAVRADAAGAGGHRDHRGRRERAREPATQGRAGRPMFDALVAHMGDALAIRRTDAYTTPDGGARMAVLDQHDHRPVTPLYNGDCMEVMPTLPDGSVHLSVYSPPFAGLYQYSSSASATCRTAATTTSSSSTTATSSPSSHRVTMPGRMTRRPLHGHPDRQHRPGRRAARLPRRHHPPARAARAGTTSPATTSGRSR